MAKKAWKVSLGQQIRSARERTGMTQEDLADRVHVVRGSIANYEKGTGNPGLRVVADIASKLKADFVVLGCRIVAIELTEQQESPLKEQLELEFNKDYSVLAEVRIRPTRKSLTITAHSDYGVKSA